MERSSSLSTAVRVVVVVFGGLLVMAGWFWRSLNAEYTGFATETIRRQDGTVAVYQPDVDGDWPQWEVVAEESSGNRAVVVERASEAATPVEVFSGTPDEAAEWALTRGREPLFVGTPQAAEEWIGEQEEGSENSMTPALLMIGGGVAALLGLVAGWDRRPSRTG
jgi:hypothetical protein